MRFSFYEQIRLTIEAAGFFRQEFPDLDRWESRWPSSSSGNVNDSSI